MDELREDVLDVRDYLAVLSRQRRLVASTVAVVVAVALLVTAFQPKVYESSASVVLRPTSAVTDASLIDQIVYTDATLQTERQIVESVELAGVVRTGLGLPDTSSQIADAVDAEIVADSQVIRITARAETAEHAALLAQGVADAYIEFRRDRAATETAAAADALEERIANIRARIADLNDELATATEDQAEMIDSSRQALLGQLATLETQIASLRSSATPSGGGEIIEAARIAGAPTSPKPLRTGVLALVLGTMLGVGLAFLRDHVDDAINSEDDVLRASGRAVLGHVPHWDGADGRGLGVASLIEPSSAVAEAYRSLRANVRFLVAGADGLRSVLITSSTQGDGKTTTAANLAVTFAAAGTRVALVDADLRRPAVARAFGLERGTGLSELLVGDATIEDVLQDVGVPNLRIVSAGRTPPNPSELLVSEEMGKFVSEIENNADLVVYDGPPTLAVADAVELASQVKGTILVVDAGSSRRRDVRRAVEKIANVGGEVVGTVLNNIRPSSGYYGYYYGGQYGEAHEPAASVGSQPDTDAPREVIEVPDEDVPAAAPPRPRRKRIVIRGE